MEAKAKWRLHLSKQHFAAVSNEVIYVDVPGVCVSKAKTQIFVRFSITGTQRKQWIIGVDCFCDRTLKGICVCHMLHQLFCEIAVKSVLIKSSTQSRMDKICVMEDRWYRWELRTCTSTTTTLVGFFVLFPFYKEKEWTNDATPWYSWNDRRWRGGWVVQYDTRLPLRRRRQLSSLVHGCQYGV